MVAMTVWPTDAADGSVATEARWRKMARLWSPNGVVDNAGGEMAPSLAFPNLTVQSGAAWVDGHYAELAGAQVLTVTANGLVVVRFDPAANTAELLYRDGIATPAQSPTGTWELPIAQTIGSVLTDLRSVLIDPRSTNLYYPNLTARNTAPNPAQIGTICTTGILAAPTGSEAPRRWIWTGAAWQFLSWWGANGAPGVYLTSASQAAANGATTQLLWSTDLRDVDGWHPPGTSGPVTVAAGWTGKYIAKVNVGWSSSFYADAAISILVNGVAAAAIQGSTANALATLTTTLYLNAGDVILVNVFHASGASKNVTGTLSIDWLGP